MSIKKILSALLITAMLSTNAACVPTWAEELTEAAPEPQPEPKEEPKQEAAPKEEPKEEPKQEAAPKEEPKEEPKQETPKEEPKKEELKKEEPKEEAPKEEPKQEAPKEEAPKEESKQEEPVQEAPKEEPKQEEAPETPADEPAQEPSDEPQAQEPEPGEEPAPQEEPVHTDEPGDAPVSEDPAPAVPETPADPTAEPQPDAPQEATQEPAATEAPVVYVPAEITALRASKDPVLLGETVAFGFAVNNAVGLRYRLTDPSGFTDSGSLSPDAGSHSFTATKAGRYTFELTATGESGAEVSASASVTAIDAPALVLSVKANAPSCHGGDPVSFSLSVTEGLELVNVSVKAALGGKTFYESGEFTRDLTVTPPAKGKVSEVSVTASVTDVYGRNAEKSVTIPCAVHDPESRAHWEATMKGVKKTGVWPEDLIAIARTQIGYTESSKDFGPKYDGGISGYTRYGDWAGMPYEEWCAMFACFCLHYAGIEEEDFPYASNCQRWINALKKPGLYAARDSYTPKLGDLVFFDWEGDNDSDHVGIIFDLDTDADGNVQGLRTIEGNSKGNAVYDGKYYKINDWTIVGYGLVNKAYDRQIEQQHRDLSAEFEGFTVQAGVEPEAKVPAHAELDVKALAPGDEGYDRMLSELKGALGEETLGYARFLEVSFLDEDGTPVEAQAPVALTVSFDGKMTGNKDFVPGVARMGDAVEISRDVTLERNKRAAAFSFTQAVDEPLCLFATGTLDYKDGKLTAKDGKLSAAVSFAAEAMIPDGSTLDFHEVAPDTDAYDACRALLGEAWPEGKDLTVRLFAVEVTFNGLPIRPAVPVQVTLDADQKAASADLLRVKDAAELVCETAPRKGGKLQLNFNADRFGTFAVTYSAE